MERAGREQIGQGAKGPGSYWLIHSREQKSSVPFTYMAGVASVWFIPTLIYKIYEPIHPVICLPLYMSIPQ